MKQGWTYKKLGEVASFMSGYTPDKSELIPQGKYPYFKVAEMNNPGNELFMRNTSLFIDSPRKVFPKGSIIFPKNGGAIYTEKKRILEYDSVIDLNTEAISPKGQIELKYLFCFLNHIKISSFDKGGGLPSMDLKKMANSLVPIPPLPEQQRIVSRLDSAFAHIDELKANAEKQVNEARALFQKALSKAMEPKEGWEEKTLGEIGLTQTGTTPSKNDKDNYGDYIPFIRPSEIDIDGYGIIEYNSEIKLSEKGLSNGRLFKKGSILMVCIGATIGKVGYCTQDISCNQQINILTPQDDYDYKYLYYAMRNPDFNERVIKEGTSAQATLPIINKGKWEKLSISFPPLSEQQRIVSRLDSLSANVKALEENQRKVMAECDALKQALLRKVFE